MSTRAFDCDGESWLAWVSGSGAYGTGVYGPGVIEAVHFARAEMPERPVFEALLPRGRLDGLFDGELIALFRGARPVVDGAALPSGPVSRRRSVDRS